MVCFLGIITSRIKIKCLSVWFGSGVSPKVSFTIEGLSPDAVAVRLEDEFGVLSRPGLQCAPAAHRHLGTFPEGTIRLSPGWQNTSHDIQVAIRGVHAVAKKSG